MDFIMTDSARIAKITWQCRRGMLELDLILLPFLNNGLNQLSEKELALFESLLTNSDPVIYSWLMGSTVPEEEELRDLVELVRRHA